MKAKEIRALARENLKQIPKKIYMSMGLSSGCGKYHTECR